MSEKNQNRLNHVINTLKSVEVHDAGTAAEIVAIIKKVEGLKSAPREVITVGDWMEMGKPVFVSAHPEYLETLEDYENAPIGTKSDRDFPPLMFEKVNHKTWTTYPSVLFTNEEMAEKVGRTTVRGKES